MINCRTFGDVQSWHAELSKISMDSHPFTCSFMLAALSDGPLLILPHFHELHQVLPWSLGRLMGAIEPCCHKHGILNSYDRVVSQTFFGAVVQEMAGSKFSQFSRLGSPCPVFFLSQAIYLMSSIRRVHGRLFSAKEAGLLCPLFFSISCAPTPQISLIRMPSPGFSAFWQDKCCCQLCHRITYATSVMVLTVPCSQDCKQADFLRWSSLVRRCSMA